MKHIHDISYPENWGNMKNLENYYKSLADKFITKDNLKRTNRFKTIQEAEEYYMGKFANTNNMHGEEDEMLERWLSEQEIEEVKGQ